MWTYLRQHPVAWSVPMSAAAVGAVLALHRDDPLFWSAWITIILGLWLARGQAKHFDSLITRLAHRGALQRSGSPIADDEVARLSADLEARAKSWEHRSGFILGVVIAIVLTVVTWNRIVVKGSVDYRLLAYGPGPVLGALGGYVVGRRLGPMLSCGLFGRALDQRRVSLRAVPGHLDGAAGLKPFGDYFFYQALVLALPAVFLLVWSLVFAVQAGQTPTVSNWRGAYLGLLGIAICLELFGFVGPLWGAHRSMESQKCASLVEVDAVLGPSIETVRSELNQDLDADQRAALRGRLDELTNSYLDIETMPTWPINRKVYRWVTLGNLALIIPLFAQLVAAATSGKTL
jgi:hypothetical protein